MRKIFIFLFLSTFLFSCKITLENQKDVLKNNRNDYKILFVPEKYYNSINLKKITRDPTSNLKFGKAEDVNFINHNLKHLRETGLLKKDMYIFSSDINHKYLYPTTSNFMLTREDTLHPFDSKKLKPYFILRKYQ